MGSLLSLLVLSAPLLLVGAAYAARRRSPVWARRALIIIMTLTWCVTAWLWIVYLDQQHDVGLMVYGILSMAATGSAAMATLLSLWLWPRMA